MALDDKRRQRAREKTTEVMRDCAQARTSTGSRGKEMNTVRGELWRRRAAGGVKEVETRMVARGGTHWPAGQHARAQ